MGKHSSCQLKKGKPAKTTPHKGYVYIKPTSVCVKDKPLTKRERAQANNIFHALDINHNKKISRTEMYDLLHVVSDWAQTNKNHNLYTAVSRSVYTSYSDTNKDNNNKNKNKKKKKKNNNNNDNIDDNNN